MSEWLLSEHQSICVCCDRKSAPMPCVLLTQCYGFFILSNQWYMKQHRHISTIDLFFYPPSTHTPQCLVWSLFMQLLWCLGLNKQAIIYFFIFFPAVWKQGEFNIDGKQAINSVPGVIQTHETFPYFQWTSFRIIGSETGAFPCTFLAKFEKMNTAVI